MAKLSLNNRPLSFFSFKSILLDLFTKSFFFFLNNQQVPFAYRVLQALVKMSFSSSRLRAKHFFDLHHPSAVSNCNVVLLNNQSLPHRLHPIHVYSGCLKFNSTKWSVWRQPNCEIILQDSASSSFFKHHNGPNLILVTSFLQYW